ncbi:MAG: hypothetical protein K9M80_02965, partial [Candidatus Marinimicrobia bacterium]|nr:hypothetical protein [Candidatus Neomarinimicrobiota bacterium]
ISLLFSIFPALNIIKIVIVNSIGLAVYILLLIISKEVTNTEIKYLLTFLNLKEIGQYGWSELKGKSKS